MSVVVGAVNDCCCFDNDFLEYLPNQGEDVMANIDLGASFKKRRRWMVVSNMGGCGLLFLGGLITAAASSSSDFLLIDDVS